MAPEQVIKRPLMLTEKGNYLREQDNKYLFEVDQGANKVEIRKAIARLFDVGVADVRTMIVRGRLRRMGRGHAKGKNWKKAIVTLRPGEKIDIFEGS